MQLGPAPLSIDALPVRAAMDCRQFKDRYARRIPAIRRGGRDGASACADASSGLATRDARARLARFGPNELASERSVPAWQRFFRQSRRVVPAPRETPSREGRTTTDAPPMVEVSACLNASSECRATATSCNLRIRQDAVRLSPAEKFSRGSAAPVRRGRCTA